MCTMVGPKKLGVPRLSCSEGCEVFFGVLVYGKGEGELERAEDLVDLYFLLVGEIGIVEISLALKFDQEKFFHRKGVVGAFEFLDDHFNQCGHDVIVFIFTDIFLVFPP